ncbi:MAG: hypothetical protein ACP5I1_08810 [Candidatus Hinthialibacter sp.]
MMYIFVILFFLLSGSMAGPSFVKADLTEDFPLAENFWPVEAA